MIRLFGRFAFVLLWTFAASYVIGSVLIDPAAIEDSADNARLALAGSVEHAARDIAVTVPSKRAAVVDRWGQRLGMATELHDGVLPNDDGAGEPTATIVSESPPTLGVRIDARQWVEFGPIPGQQWPRTVKAMNISGLVDAGLIAFAALLLTLPLALRLRRLREAADKIHQGRYETRTGLRGRDPVGRVAQRFDEMAAAVHRALVAHRELAQAVSHEFRTPLARIRFAAEELTTADDETTREARRRDIDRDLDELDELVEEMLMFGRVEGAAHRAEEVAVDEVVSAIAERSRDMGPAVAVTSSEPTSARVIRREFIRAVQNLVTNAQRHAVSRVQVQWSRVNDRLVIHVDDDGEGVPADSRERIFEPFAAGPRGGTGLGLALVRRIAELHDGAVEVDAAPIGGARFTLSLPDVRIAGRP